MAHYVQYIISMQNKNKHIIKLTLVSNCSITKVQHDKHKNSNKGVTMVRKTSLSKAFRNAPSKNVIRMFTLLRLDHIIPSMISPNYIASFAHNRSIKLTSNEIVYINNNYK